MQKVCSSPTDEQDNTLERITSAGLSSLTREESCELKQTQSCTDPPTQIHSQTDEAHSPFVKLTRLPFIEDHITELKQLSCFVYSSKGRTCTLLQPGEEDVSDLFLKLEHGDNAADTQTYSNSSYQSSVTPTRECALLGRHSKGHLEDNPAGGMNDVTLNGTSVEDLELEDPVCFYQQAWDFEEEGNDEFPVDLCSDAEEDESFVCPVALQKLLSGQDEALLMDVSLDVCIHLTARIDSYRITLMEECKQVPFLFFLPVLIRERFMDHQRSCAIRPLRWFIAPLRRTTPRAPCSSCRTCYSRVTTFPKTSPSISCVTFCSGQTAPTTCVCRLFTCWSEHRGDVFTLQILKTPHLNSSLHPVFISSLPSWILSTATFLQALSS